MDTNKKISENQNAILELIERYPFINTEDIAGELELSFRKTKEHLRKLKNKEMLFRVDGGKGGYWKVER